MTYEIYRTIFVVTAVLAVLFLIITIILFFALNVPRIIGDLSGTTERKAIQRMHEQKEQSFYTGYDPWRINKRHEKITDKISLSGRLIKNSSGDSNMHSKKGHTEKLAEQTWDKGNACETEVLNQDMNATMVLYGNMNETTVLKEEMIDSVIFEIEQDITFIHTQEIVTN